MSSRIPDVKEMEEISAKRFKEIQKQELRMALSRVGAEVKDLADNGKSVLSTNRIFELTDDLEFVRPAMVAREFEEAGYYKNDDCDICWTKS